MRLVDSVARSVRTRAPANIRHDDIVSFGREGLLDAARRYDTSRGVSFQAWAALRVRGAIIDGLRAHGVLTRGGNSRVVAHDPSDVSPSETPEDRVANAEIHQAVRASVARLSSRERRMVERMYFDDESMPRVSAELGVSVSWASRIHARAVAKLGCELRRRRVA